MTSGFDWWREGGGGVLEGETDWCSLVLRIWFKTMSSVH